MNIHVASLLFVTLVWGATFPVLKIATAQLSGVEVSALRFVIAAACMLPWTLRVGKSTWKDGALLGGLVLVSYVAQAFGLEFISSNRSAFLTSLNVLMVPLLGIVMGERLRWNILLCALMALVGIGLMSWEGGSNLLADASTVLGALAYAVYVIVLSQRSKKHQPRQLAATQIFCMALFGVLWMLLLARGTDQLGTLYARLNWEIVLGLTYLGIVATAGMLFLQAVAQRYVSADKAALIYAMEPVFAAMFAWVWISETLTVQAAIGAGLVVGAVILSELRSSAKLPSEPSHSP